LDDEEDYAEMLRDLLLDHNYRVDMATRPERAINQLEEIPYDLVISDYKMPVMDGADFLKRARELYPNLPFILVSGLMNTPELVKVANMSVTLVMEKPLDTTAFLDYVGRFSEPMTEEEKAEFTTGGGEGDSQLIVSYPDEPRYFSATCASSKRFMLDLWSVCKTGSLAVIQEPLGGEAELSVKDVSFWLGNSDKPVRVLDWAALKGGTVADLLQGLVDDEESSNVALVRCPEDLPIEKVTDRMTDLETVARRAGSLLVIVCGGDLSEASFAQVTSGKGVTLPSFETRSTDVAQYARRFARIAAGQRGKEKATAFTPEAAYAILAYEWSRNYRQLNEVITAAVEASENESITLESLKLDNAPEAEPSLRMERLLRKAQSAYLKQALEAFNGNASALAKEIQPSASVYSERDLAHLPLIKPDLASL